MCCGTSARGAFTGPLECLASTHTQQDSRSPLGRPPALLCSLPGDVEIHGRRARHRWAAQAAGQQSGSLVVRCCKLQAPRSSAHSSGHTTRGSLASTPARCTATRPSRQQLIAAVACAALFCGAACGAALLLDQPPPAPPLPPIAPQRTSRRRAPCPWGWWSSRWAAPMCRRRRRRRRPSGPATSRAAPAAWPSSTPCAMWTTTAGPAPSAAAATTFRPPAACGGERQRPVGVRRLGGRRRRLDRQQRLGRPAARAAAHLCCIALHNHTHPQLLQSGRRAARGAGGAAGGAGGCHGAARASRPRRRHRGGRRAVGAARGARGCLLAAAVCRCLSSGAAAHACVCMAVQHSPAPPHTRAHRAVAHSHARRCWRSSTAAAGTRSLSS